jgi:hypothetical protein
MWVSQENPKFPQKIPGALGGGWGRDKFKTKGHYCGDIHIPNEL